MNSISVKLEPFAGRSSSSAEPTTEKNSLLKKRRRHFRYLHENEALLRFGDRHLRGRIVNASKAGACLEMASAVDLPIGTRVSMDWIPIPELNGLYSNKNCHIGGTVLRNQEIGAKRVITLKFDRLVHEQQAMQASRGVKMIAVAAAVSLVAAISFLKVHNFVYFWYDPWFQAYSIAAAAFVVSRVGISMFYKEPADQGYFPRVSIVIAAKNEEAHIGRTVEHCLNSHYPPDLVEIFAIDDGSTDRTWDVIEKLQEKYPQVKAVRFEKNKGKRHAMAAGAERASGDILVYVDSDSYVDPDSLYRIVQPFMNETVGAVSGHVLAAIEKDNFISKMEAARYYISHRVMKAAESVFGVVTCCPGAFSAYRRSAVMKVLPDWIGQRFWGTSATFGDDRSLTNFILREYQVIYHAGATCITYVPRTLSQFFRQQLRWKKSWARETTVASRLMYKKHPVSALFYYIGVVLTLISPIMAVRALVYIPIFSSMSSLPYLLGLFLVYLFLCLIYLYYTQSPYWYYGLLFAVFYLFLFSFQNYYAIATVRKNHWGTR